MGLDLKKMATHIEENLRNLNKCTKHNFAIDITPEKKFDKRYKCTKCGGEVSATAKYWYEKGREHKE
jgi:hypothetical protein